LFEDSEIRIRYILFFSSSSAHNFDFCQFPSRFWVETGVREGRARGRILASPCGERSLSVPASGDGFRRIENPEQQQRCGKGGAGKHPSAVLCIPQPSHGGGAVGWQICMHPAAYIHITRFQVQQKTKKWNANLLQRSTRLSKKRGSVACAHLSTRLQL
ncbi:unnamed protein product, partial [Ectocarpus sp. 12 AP-2014]